MREQLRRLPKAELHVHLDGSLRAATMIDIARETGVTLPVQDTESLARWMLVDDAGDLEDYLRRFDITIALLQRPEDIERVAYEMVADAAADGLRYLEVRYAPWLSTHQGLSLDDVIRAEWAGFQRGEREFGVVTRIISCTLRHWSPQRSLEIAEHSVSMRGSGVVGFDIAGGEAGRPCELHREAFDLAARGGLGITVHAGEAAGWESIFEAIHSCHAVRIGHGTRLFENPALLEYVREHQICLEVNITSNLQTRVVRSAAEHPVRRYFDAGVAVALGSDSWLMSGVSLTDEYVLAHEALGFTWSELQAISTTAFEHAFLPSEERRALLKRVADDPVSLT